jgi:hypothetical protein
VVASAGSRTSMVSAMDAFTFVGVPRPVRPAIVSLRPRSGPLTGRTVVTVRGNDLSRATRVEFGVAVGTDLTVDASGTSLTVRTPPVTKAGVVQVRVVTPSGTSSRVAADQFTYVPPAPVYHRLSRPRRLLDTGAKGGGGPLRAGATRTVRVAGAAGVPADATRVVLRMRVTAGRVATALTVWPAGATRPADATARPRGHGTVTKTVTVILGARGAIAMYNRAGSAGIRLTVEGYYAPAGSTPDTPSSRSSSLHRLFEGASRS